MRRKPLGESTDFHAARAKKLLDDSWRDIERMPPTCRGGVVMAARAFANAERAQGHLASIGDRRERAEHTELYGSANRASKAAWEAVQFFASVCEAPYSKTRKQPLTSRRKR
jgi:hypothetical protein